ncbi:hypothetical protein [Streptomyces sp. NEAU-W12]|uniref:hypothetical protein n=1 Tax=Streptomyces sp. NEAU-W12 TaxID=2994668 RepID=UPI00224A4C83|nr:hypothetical protein [Streptomyces sp. NEAU-W12]MCX2923835.1 hypothetical protein [Streptomyces sp. NEAU-W12]
MPSVAVLVELLRRDTSGGQVKCWEHFARSAARLPGRIPDARGGTPLDLTLYFLGERERVESLSPHVRFVMLRPVLSSAAVRSADGAEDVCDLAPYHPRLAALLPRHDVWHLTHSFTFAATAVRLAHCAARRSLPRPRLIGSVHTDVPLLASVYARYLAERRLPGRHPRVDDLLAGRARPAATASVPNHSRRPSRSRCSRADSGTAKTSSATISGCTRLSGPNASASDWNPYATTASPIPHRHSGSRTR